jgi:hypothetical protein
MHTCVGSSLAQDADNSPTRDGRSNQEVGDLPLWETGVGQIFNLPEKKVEDVDLQLRKISVGQIARPTEDDGLPLWETAFVLRPESDANLGWQILIGSDNL